MNKARILLSGKTNLQYYIEAVNAVSAQATAKYLPDVDTNYGILRECASAKNGQIP